MIWTKRIDKSALAIASRWRIEVSFLAAPVVLWVAHPTTISMVRWLGLAVVGLALRCWARGHLERRAQLTQTGPYALMRHPLYVGSFLLGLAFCLMTNVPWVAMLFVVAFVSAYVPKALREETFLRARYGDEYDRYAARVGAVVPLVRLSRGGTAPARDRFTWRRVFRHREYLTWIGATAVFVAMWARASFP
jgi:protein-S-isoprenylcysteine O-methyltransferase Ste14